MDKLYTQRMMVVRLLALKSGCNYGLGKDDNEDWDDEWRNVVYIDLPEGQVSWHIAPHDLHLFDDFPQYKGKWDGNFNGNDCEFIKSVKSKEDLSPEQQAEVLRKAAILDELIELRGMATRGRWEEDTGGEVITDNGCTIAFPKDEIFKDGNFFQNVQAITEIMNKLEQER